MTGRIIGVNRSSLWLAWKEIRRELRNATVRDVADFLDYDIEPDVWISRLLRQISLGTFEPSTPLRFPIAKSPGFKRTLTFPAIPDLVVYRAIADYIHRRANKYQQPHVYYRRADFHRATAAAHQAAEDEMHPLASDYRFTSTHSFLNWLNYSQYRKRLIVKKVFPFIVVSDITNFFNSVLHSEVSNAFRDFPIPSRLIGLLFFLLERLAVRADYSDSPGIGLPVDEFECSRTIANLVLFSHDDRVVKISGKDAYVRWMDDQVIGVASRGEGLRLLSLLEESLANLHLTANAKKSVVLSLSDAKSYFHLTTNAALDGLEAKITKRSVRRRTLVCELSRAWHKALRREHEGQWNQIQGRFYRLGGLTKARFLRSRAGKDLLENPSLAARISDYVRCSGSVTEYIGFVRVILGHREQIHDDVALVFVESLLRLETLGRNAVLFVQTAKDLLNDIRTGERTALFAAPASLLILRFGGRRHVPALRRYFREDRKGMPSQAIRAAAIVCASYGNEEFQRVRKAAAVFLLNPLALMVRLALKISRLAKVPDRYKARLNIRRDSVSGKRYLDMRVLLAARLLTLNRKKSVRSWLKTWTDGVKKQGISAFDKRLLARLLP
jgi:hypothetical protein